MTLWTVQPYCVYELLQLEGVYRCNPDLSQCLVEFGYTKAYDWICKQMKKRIGNPPSPNIKYPVWAWYCLDGKHKRPDMRRYDMKVSEKSVLLEIDIPESDVLLTDEVDWHIVLNDNLVYKASYISGLSDEELELEFKKEDIYYANLSAEEKLAYKEKSWENVIVCSTSTSLPSYVQATFWELKKQQIKKTWILRE